MNVDSAAPPHVRRAVEPFRIAGLRGRAVKRRKDEILGAALRSPLARPGGHRHFPRLHSEPIVRELDRRSVLFTRRGGRGGEFGPGWTAERSQEAQLRLQQQRHGVRGGPGAEDRPLQAGPAELSKESFQASAV